MSKHPTPELSAGAGSHPSGQNPENEALPIGTIAGIGMVTAVIFAIAVLWAVQIMNGVVDDNEREFGPWQKGVAIGRPEVGMVDQQLFSVEKRAAQLAQDKLQKLDGYGWVSRKDQIIHVPITEAMKAVTEGKRAPRAAVPGVPPTAPVPGVPEQGAAPAPEGAEPPQGQPAQPAPTTP